MLFQSLLNTDRSVILVDNTKSLQMYLVFFNLKHVQTSRNLKL